MPNSFLFVGGPADGARIDVAEPGKDYIIALSEENRVRYMSATLGGSTHKFHIYIAPGMNGDDVIAALLKGYRRA
jgi:hypothetical protein